jgi:predicted nuclease of predicted toxin-antitoxin system
MKLLLDENLPHQLRHELPGHNCFTVTFMGWAGVENGELLARASTAGFDALLTKDTKLQYQQNPATLPIAVVVISAASNDMEWMIFAP